MKIISKEKDFYDYMLAYGVDETEVFVRETYDTYKSIEKGESENTVNALLRMNHFRYEMSAERFNRDESVKYKFGLTLIYFCGEIVPAIWLKYKTIPEKGSSYYDLNNEWKIEHLYTKDDFLNKCRELDIESIDNTIGIKTDIKDRLVKRLNNAKKSMNEREPLRIFNRWSHELMASYYEINVMDYSKDKPMDEKYNFSITVHPILRDLQFSKYKNGTQVFQEVEQYLFGELKAGQRETVEISDEDMAVAKGHGGKYSFKKLPSKKRSKK